MKTNCIQRILPFMAIALFIGLFAAGSVKAYAKDSGEVIPVYRLFNESNNEHLYTTNPTERDNCISVGWKDEGVGWYAPQRSDWPVRRIYHPGTGYHLYSQNPQEMEMLASAGWKLEGVAFYSSQTKAVEIRRQYLPALNLHNYSYNPAEIEQLRAAGWKIEGTAWFACIPPKNSEKQNEPVPQKETVTTGMKNALATAQQYLDILAFSRTGLIEQLEYEGYTNEEAVYAVDNCGANWKEQAVLMAKDYLDVMPFSYSGLIEQLEFEDFTHDEAVYGVNNCGANWKEQAVLMARSYLDTSSFSYSGLIEQLEFEDFTHDEAVYGVNNCGADWGTSSSSSGSGSGSSGQGKSVSSGIITNPSSQEIADADYIVNIKTEKFHRPSCKDVAKMSSANKAAFNGDRQELIDQGYDPCSHCNP